MLLMLQAPAWKVWYHFAHVNHVQQQKWKAPASYLSFAIILLTHAAAYLLECLW